MALSDFLQQGVPGFMNSWAQLQQQRQQQQQQQLQQQQQGQFNTQFAGALTGNQTGSQFLEGFGDFSQVNPGLQSLAIQGAMKLPTQQDMFAQQFRVSQQQEKDERRTLESKRKNMALIESSGKDAADFMVAQVRTDMPTGMDVKGTRKWLKDNLDSYMAGGVTQLEDLLTSQGVDTTKGNMDMGSRFLMAGLKNKTTGKDDSARVLNESIASMMRSNASTRRAIKVGQDQVVMRGEIGRQNNTILDELTRMDQLIETFPADSGYKASGRGRMNLDAKTSKAMGGLGAARGGSKPYIAAYERGFKDLGNSMNKILTLREKMLVGTGKTSLDPSEAGELDDLLPRYMSYFRTKSDDFRDLSARITALQQGSGSGSVDKSFISDMHKMILGGMPYLRPPGRAPLLQYVMKQVILNWGQ